jgi:hypothetical protein
VAALITTWSQTVAYTHSGLADFFVHFWHDAKVTASARNITADILMFALSAAVLMVIEARKHGVSVTFPLFLIAREMRIGASDSPRLHAIDAVLLAVLATGLTGLTIWVDLG